MTANYHAATGSLWGAYFKRLLRRKTRAKTLAQKIAAASERLDAAHKISDPWLAKRKSRRATRALLAALLASES